MDGNGRWAKKRFLPRIAGHKQGVEAVRRISRAARKLGIEALTLYAFSSENWRRPEEEVRDLMGLLRQFLASELEELISEGVKLRVIGDWRRLQPDLVSMIDAAISRTADNPGPTLVIALNYGAQAEILAAARRLAEQVQDGVLAPEGIDAQRFEASLETADLPPLDLMIRTSGEQRLSNFLLWQAAYAELLFVDTLWPDFDEAALAAAIDQFGKRQRRFGGL
ncbi:di-trans,poly-cis-decaprenylcistransferase [Sphingomonas sp. IC-56]|uniref:polyprenyl diphosphate synthase n=1 Tax=Sphingomonas sp. IC-56 TaxID=2898529 RepID=UPI001E4B6DF1|nr:polyprenyl diphosphate synthase [Sphingomonas sp. IC-56]MCD2324839.1 di-trans,poly-cis-decaprenylcistransferase [Sphingomonas sp. IC-56]